MSVETAAAKPRSIPTGTEILGFVVNALGLRDRIESSTFKAAARGDAVKPKSVKEIVTELVNALWTEDLTKDLGVDAAQRGAHNGYVVGLVLWVLRAWDERRSSLHVGLAPGEAAAALMPFLRLTALDLGLRMGAYCWLDERRTRPWYREPPTWFYSDGFGRNLDQILARAGKRVSHETIAAEIGVTKNAFSDWCTGRAFPRTENIEKLAHHLASLFSNHSWNEVEYALRLSICLCWARRELVVRLGEEPALDLIMGGLWVAEHVLDELRAVDSQRGVAGVGGLVREVVSHGALSGLGELLTRRLANRAPNPWFRDDLLALPKSWVGRIGWWMPVFQSEISPANQKYEATRFFSGVNLDELGRLAEEKLLTHEGANALGHTYASVENWSEAARCYSRACALQNDNADYHYNLAIALSRGEDARHPDPEHRDLAVLHRALDECRIAAEIDRQKNVRRAEPRIQIGILLMDLDRHEDAARAFEDAKPLAPESADLEYHWGLALMESMQFEQAALHYENAVKLEPRHAWAWTNLSYVRALLEQWKPARDAAKQAERLGNGTARRVLDQRSKRK